MLNKTWNTENKRGIKEWKDALKSQATHEGIEHRIGLGKDDPNAQNENLWRGQNLLGKILTQVREKLRETYPI